MSRSIHTTRATLRKLERTEFPTTEARAEALQEQRRALRRKRRIKRQTAAERKSQPVSGTRTTANTVAIEVRDKDRHVHHAISPDEVRTVLALLPPSATEGITCVRLSLGREENEEHCREHGGSADPWVGRLGSRLFPGVFSGNVLGLFLPRRGLIEVFAYVVDPLLFPLPRELCHLYLRLHALKTLVHEVAHFHDQVARVRRGRWLADRKENLEWYAEQKEHAWTLDVVLPYLERTYSRQCKALRLWVQHRGGMALPLALVAGDPRRTDRNGTSWWVSSTSNAFEAWLDDLPGCSTLTDSRLALAWSLHYADKYDECLQTLDGILVQEPRCVKALSCRADTLVHLERFDEAMAAAEAVLLGDPSDDRAWETRADVFEHRRDWAGLLACCDNWSRATRKPKGLGRDVHRYRAIAQCALGQDLEMERSLAAYIGSIRFRSEDGKKLQAAIARRATFRRAGRPVPPDPLLESRSRKK
jgi:hypothetical protein